MRSFPPCDLQLYILTNCSHLRNSLGGKKEKEKKKGLFLILSVLDFGLGTNHKPLVNKHLRFPLSSSRGGGTWQTREDKMSSDSFQQN